MKKNIRFAMLLGLCGLFFTACEQEEEQQIISGNCFRVEAPKFVDNEKTYLQYTDDLSRIIYEEGDKVYINGVEFTLSKDGSGTWWANSSQTVTAPELYVAYADGAVADWNESAHTYSFNLNSTLNSIDHNKVVLCGTARENNYAITLAPACAILRLNTRGAGINYSYVKVGFDGNKIPKQGTVTPASHTLSANGTQFLEGVTQGGAGEFLYMTHSNTDAGEGDYWYVAIPISGSSVTTTLYLEWNNGSETIKHKTQGQVTLQKGYVYTVGTSRASAFNVNGIGNKRFRVSSSQYVRFSAGNLQSIRDEDPDTYARSNKWRFAEHQYDMVLSSNGSISEGNTSTWIDLFGWGTSGNNTGRTSGIAYEPYATTGTFGYSDPLTDLAGNTADWGVANVSNIYYGSRISTVSWRTLTSDEWNYLISRSGLCGYATINGQYQGLVLLPDEGWSLPDGLTWNSSMNSYSNNTYTLEQWDKMEMAGAIFLPAAGYRANTTVSGGNTYGYYWTTSNTGSNVMPGMNQAYAMSFNGSAAPNASNAQLRSRGFAVRLVMNN